MQSLKAPKGVGSGLDVLPSSFGFTADGLGDVAGGNTGQGVGVMIAELRKNIHAAQGPKRNLSGSIVRVNVYPESSVGNHHYLRRLAWERDRDLTRRALQQQSAPVSTYFTVTKTVQKEVCLAIVVLVLQD